ncbi:Tryptophan--tRNA ligase, mitochondrial [Coemansia sp. RSA 2131]|nr:Tryptophan--tRNA ligase, mitochondrial [Coemansia sp. RSA 2131]
MNKVARVFSGIQPTGVPQLGNYLGSIKNWVTLQSQHLDPASPHPHDQYISIVDLHALTVPRPPSRLRTNTFEMAASLIACGIDPSRTVLFRQSTVPAHTQLMWALACITPVGWLNRMTQWKSKLHSNQPHASLNVHSAAAQSLLTGLFTYPVLMAADVLLYGATHIPVGDDQIQHIEFTRDICDQFHKTYGPVFSAPRVLLTQTKRVMSLKDPMRKMSKSDPNESSRINLNDSDDAIMRKIRKAHTDCINGISFDPVARPGISSLLSIYAALRSVSVEQVVQEMQGLTNLQMKEAVASAVIDTVGPIREHMARLVADRGYVENVLRVNEEKAKSVASANWQNIAKCIGLS